MSMYVFLLKYFPETSPVIMFSWSSVSLPGPFLGADLAVKRSSGAKTLA
jgi:hypothetical protein